MPYTEAQKRANRKYNEKSYDRIELKVRRGRKAKIKAVAKKQGESLNGFVTAAIDERVERLDSFPAADNAPSEQTQAWRDFLQEISAIDDEPLPEKFERVKLREVEV